MSELIEYADAEQVVIDWLNGLLPSTVRASGRVPGTRPRSFVRVLVTGGSDLTLITELAQITIEAWAGTDVQAAALAGQVRAFIMRAGRDGWMGATPCLSVELISRPQSLPDPVTDQIRYTATYAVALRGSGA